MSRRRSVAFIPVAVGALLAGSAPSAFRPHHRRGPTPVRCLTGTRSRRTRSSRSRGRTAVRRPHSRSTWAWCRAPCTTPSTRSARSSTSHICSRIVRVRRRRSTLPSQRRRTTCSQISSRMHPTSAPFPGRAGLLTTLSTESHASLDAIANGAFKTQGIEIGHAAAKAMLDARVGDGRFGPSQWVQNTGAGHWQPLLNAAGQPILDPTPWAGGVKPFLIQSSSQFRSVPPPALDSAQWATEFNEVKSLGRVDSATRTAEQTYVARWWQSAPGLQLERGRPAAHRPERPRRRRRRTTPRAAEHEWGGRRDQLLERQVPLRLLAAVERDHHDVGRWERRHHDRPDVDGAHHRALSRVDLGAQLPRRRTRHRAAAVVRRCARQLRDHEHSPRITEGPRRGHFDTFSQPLAELIEARIWAGLHYRSADVAGQLLGGNVARYGIANYLQPAH